MQIWPNFERVIKLSSPSRSICPWTSYPSWTEVSSDGSRSLGRHWIWPPAGVERTVLWFTLPALESHKLVQQVSSAKSNAVTSTNCTYLNASVYLLLCSRKDYSGEYTVFLIPCTVQPTQAWVDSGDKPLSCTAHAPEKYVTMKLFHW